MHNTQFWLRLSVLSLLTLLVLCTAVPAADETSSPEGQKINLGGCIDITLQKNFAMKESLENLIQKEAELWVEKDTLVTRVSGYYQAGASGDPQGDEEMAVKGELSYKMPMGDEISFNSEVMRTNLTHRVGQETSFEYRYPLARGGGVIIGWQNVRKAQRNLTMQELKYFSSRQDVVLTIIRRYFDLLQAKKLISVNESAVASARDNLVITRKKYEEGLIAKIDLTRAEIRFLDAQTGLLSQIKNWEDRRDSLLVGMGLDPRKGIEIDYDVAYFPKDFGETECVELALLLRKELLISGEELFQIKENVVVAENNMKPRIDLVTSYSTSEKAFLYTGIDTWNYPSWSAMLECSIDISDRSLKEELLKSRRLVLLYEEKLAEIKRAIIKEVRDNIRTVNLAAARVELRDKSVKAAEDRLHLATRSWEEGLITNREVVDAQTDLVNAQSELLRAKIDYILAEYDLNKSMGIDLSHFIAEEQKKMKQQNGSRKNAIDSFLGVGNKEKRVTR